MTSDTAADGRTDESNALTALSDDDVIKQLRFHCWQSGMFESSGVGKVMRGFDGSHEAGQAVDASNSAEPYEAELKRRLARPSAPVADMMARVKANIINVLADDDGESRWFNSESEANLQRDRIMQAITEVLDTSTDQAQYAAAPVPVHAEMRNAVARLIYETHPNPSMPPWEETAPGWIDECTRQADAILAAGVTTRQAIAAEIRAMYPDAFVLTVGDWLTKGGAPHQLTKAVLETIAARVEEIP